MNNVSWIINFRGTLVGDFHFLLLPFRLQDKGRRGEMVTLLCLYSDLLSSSYVNM